MAFDLSLVVVAYDMDRELPRTLRSLSGGCQQAVDPESYEIVVVDNGSPHPVDLTDLGPAAPRVRLHRIDPAPASPARAANTGLAAAEGDLVGLVVDGARMASPGLVSGALRASRLDQRAVIATLGWHLGRVSHAEVTDGDAQRELEDRLLADVRWEADGYRMFEISTPARSSSRGWFGPMGESSALFLRRSMWDELGGLDEAFELPGGGLVNHDAFRRACELPASQLVVLLGEGTFHQYHGGAATSRRFSWEEMATEYERLRGGPYQPPTVRPVYAGPVPRSILPSVRDSAERASSGPRLRYDGP